VKDLKNLIRLHRWRLDERRTQLRALEHEIEALKHRVQYLEDDHAAQQSLKTKTVLNEVHYDGAIYGQYIISFEEKKSNLYKELNQLQTQMIELVDEITTIFQEVKKFEISQENKDLEERDRASKELQGELDDIGLSMKRRMLN
jgi:flagellar protein FliJ